jgi:hypothetical protein
MQAAGYDFDGQPVRIEGEGVLVQFGGEAFLTDGSAAKGEIPLNPAEASGLEFILGAYGKKLRAMGATAAEGAVLMKSGGQLVFKSIADLKNLYKNATLKEGVRLASFSCTSTDGTTTLGLLDVEPNTFIYIDATGAYKALTHAELVAILAEDICENLEEATEEDTVLHTLVCTADGLKKGTSLFDINYVPGRPIIYAQRKTVVAPPAYDIEYPPSPGYDIGYFSTNFVDVDLTLQDGYSENAHSVILDARGSAYSGAGGTYGWAVVLVIQGLEHMRFGQNKADQYNIGANSGIIIPIPESKVIRIEGVRQGAGSSTTENAALMVFLNGFIG